MKLPNLEDDEPPLARNIGDGLENAVSSGTAIVRKMTRSLAARASEKCKDGDNSALCQKPTDTTNTQTLPIVLGAVIPICFAICVFIYLHRKNKKKQALEDANDPHKSLDFGVEFGGGPSNKGRKPRFGRNRGPPEMTITHMNGPSSRPGNKTRGMSMDMLGSPYLLPADLHGSRDESLHSMSRLQDEHDPYRPVTFARNSSETNRSPRPFNENASMYSVSSTVQTGNENRGLVDNARSMPQSFPRRGDSFSPTSESDGPQNRDMFSANQAGSTSRKPSLSSSNPALANITENSPPINQQETLPPLPPLPKEALQPAEQTPGERAESSNSVARPPPRKASLAASAQPVIDPRSSDASYYEEELPPPPQPPPMIFEPEQTEADNPADMYTGRFSIDNSAPSHQLDVDNNRMSMVQNNRVSVMGLRPLPPDHPEDNPEQRANRIRSFYKEYFDDSRPKPPTQFYEDLDADFLDAAIFDPETGQFFTPQAPFAQPVGRRAMTPPPRGPSHFQGAAHDRHYSTMSAGGPRGRPRMPLPPKKKLPPPKTLQSLPTPHMLKDDTMLMNPIDFAPPTSFRELQNGRRPDSPMGIQRPYSPGVKAFSPLATTFDELSAIPSPHHLRKSGTFSALDFAPPRFRPQDGSASDAGSIRSARSGISAMQMDAVRAGAYRVSRIPKEFVTSKDDLTTQLRPQMNLIRPA